MTLSSARPGLTGVTYDIGDGTNGFIFQTSHTVDAIVIQACTSPVAGTTCTNTPGTTTPDFQSVAGFDPSTGWANWQDTTTFTHDTSSTPTVDGLSSDCSNHSTICMTRTAGGAEDNSSKHKIEFTNVTNPDPNGDGTGNATFYLRIATFTDASYTTEEAEGAVAGAVTQTLLVQAYVAEILVFCVGNTTVDDADTTNAGTCSSISGTTVDFGILDPTQISQTPVPVGPGDPRDGNNTNGLAILRTNAANGSSVSYDAIQDGSGGGNEGSLKIQGADCAGGTSLSCITSAGAQGTLTYATDQPEFGMTIAGVNCVQELTYGASGLYPCSYSGGTEHLVPQSGYIGYTGDYCPLSGSDYSCLQADGGNGYAWDDSGGSNTIAAATASVADEALILKFAAEDSLATTYGSYKVYIDYTAVATF